MINTTVSLQNVCDFLWSYAWMEKQIVGLFIQWLVGYMQKRRESEQSKKGPNIFHTVGWLCCGSVFISFTFAYMYGTNVW